jgi:hypothetical protein
VIFVIDLPKPLVHLVERPIRRRERLVPGRHRLQAFADSERDRGGAEDCVVGGAECGGYVVIEVVAAEF